MKNLIMILLFILLAMISACKETEIYYAGSQIDENINNIQADSKNVDLFNTINSSLYSGTEVEYMSGVKGYLSIPSMQGSYPSIILIHEWWGLNDNIRTMANLLAQEGYVVLAVDLYEGEYAQNSSEAGKLAGAVRQNGSGAIKNMKAASAYLRNHSFSNGEVASMGWCFGGQQSLQFALSGENLSATVIYYGNLVNDTVQLSNIEWPVLGIFGSNDTSIPVSSVNEFEKILNELNVENEIYIYENVGHAFANPSGARYAPNETIDAWDKTVKFLNNNLKESD